MKNAGPQFGAPVRGLQTMLRTISFVYHSIPRLLPDGIFGERTLEAVMIFQREFYPRVTGQVDNATWDAIAARYVEAAEQLAPPRPCPGYPGGDALIRPGERSVHLYLIQAMFRALSRILEDIAEGPVSDVHEDLSVENTKRVQRAGDLADNGIIDKATWDVTARLYATFVSGAQTPWLSRQEVLSQP